MIPDDERAVGVAPDLADGAARTLDELERAVDAWLDAGAARFDPLTWDLDRKTEYYRKAFCEAGLYLSVLEELGDRPAASIVPDLESAVVGVVNDPRYAGLLRREPRHLLKYAYPAAYAKSVGALAPETGAAVDDVLAGRAVWAFERAPHRLLDIWYFCELWGHDAELSPGVVLGLGSLAHPPDPVTATLEDAYALTHNLLYYHGFGVGEGAVPTEFDLDDAITGLLVRFLAEDNTDVVLELLVVGVLEDRLSPALVAAVLNWITESAAELGFVPGPESTHPPAGADPATAEWELNYHTNLVAGMAVRILRHRWLPTVLAGEATGDEDAGEDVEALRPLGEVLVALADYDLDAGARALLEVVETPAAGRYPGVVAAGAEFLRDQRRPDGGYGYWTDEASLHAVLGNDPDDFERLVAPTEERCARALREFDASDVAPVADAGSR